MEEKRITNEQVMERLNEVMDRLDRIEEYTEKTIVSVGAFANAKLEEIASTKNFDKTKALVFAGIVEMTNQIAMKATEKRKPTCDKEEMTKDELVELIDILNSL